MVDNIQSSSGASRVDPAAGKTTGGAGSLAAGAAFQALLERLETQARELELQSRTIENQKDLTGAVDRAHASLQDVLSLGDRLVEAYREALARSQAGGKP
jgi:flagellar hook-basal body complex protein FliE